MKLGLGKPFATKELLLIASIVSFFAWLGTFAAGFVLYGTFSLGVLVMLLTLGWVAITGGAVWYASRNTPAALKTTFVWKFWVGISGAALAINLIAGGVVAAGLINTPAPITSAPMQYGVILPWLLAYGIGYLVTAGYARNDARLTTPERAIYGIFGIASLALGGVLAVMPTLHGPMLFALAVLSLGAVPTLYWR